jgi:hypothetical protein
MITLFGAALAVQIKPPAPIKPPQINEMNVARIRVGMMRWQVEKILGPPRREGGNIWWELSRGYLKDQGKVHWVGESAYVKIRFHGRIATSIERWPPPRQRLVRGWLDTIK